MVDVDGHRPRPRRGRALITASLVLGCALVAAGLLNVPAAGGVASTLAPIMEPGVQNVTADALPSVQVDGVVWSQAIVGNRVYAGGTFSRARPAGSAPGHDLTRRTDLLAYDITTGVLITSFAPTVNGTVKTVATSPDGTRVYVGGLFTVVNGRTRNRIAAFDARTGSLIAAFAPSVNSTVNTIVATDTRVYAGGAFSAVGPTGRGRLAAFSAATGALLGWRPKADASVQAMVITPDASKVIVGGSFGHVNGSPVWGLSAIDRASGAVLPWAANRRVRDYGSSAGITSLSTDGAAIYGSGFVFHASGGHGTLEGTFSANPSTGALNWVEDCNGDTYGTHARNGVVYTVSHAHSCATVGGFPDTSPKTSHHALAFTAAPMGTLRPSLSLAYTDWGGTPAPAMYNWFPDLQPGTFTGQGQAAWDIAGDGRYVIMGGEFPTVNGVAQQGIVRFAIRPPAPGVQGPRVRVAPTVSALSSTSVRVTWQTSWDRDNENLTYQVIRNDNAGAPVHTDRATSQFWNRPTISFTDTGLTPGTRYTYKIDAIDPFGNTLLGSGVGVTTPL